MAECLPDWVNEGTRTQEFLKWLECGGEYIGSFSEWSFMKGTMQNCVLVYGLEQSGTDRFHFIRLCGIFRKTDCALYEVSPVLYQAIGIPKEFCFPDKESVRSEIEEKVTDRGKKLMDEAWDQLVIRSGCTREQLIPMINREQIRMAARRYFQMGKSSKDISYLPRFSFESIWNGLPDETFLKYLNDESKTVETVTEVWLKEHLSEISKKRIYYGCVREEMADMEKSGHIGNKNSKRFMNVQSTEKKSA